MKTNSSSLMRMSFGLLLSISTLELIFAKSVGASTVTSLPGGAGSVPGITYEWQVQMNQEDTATFSRSVGAFSWNEPSNPVGLKGWTHTSNWVMLELTNLSSLTLKIERASGIPNGSSTAGDTLYPAFCLYSGWQNSGTEDHTYNNTGNTDWADSLSYLGSQANGGNYYSISKSFTLPAGLYSIAIGGDPLYDATVRREGYLATVSTTAVPEPKISSLLIGLISLSYVFLPKKGNKA